MLVKILCQLAILNFIFGIPKIFHYEIDNFDSKDDEHAESYIIEIDKDQDREESEVRNEEENSIITLLSNSPGAKLKVVKKYWIWESFLKICRKVQ